MRLILILLILVFSGTLSGCEDTDIRLATEAGVEAYKAVTLSDEAVAELSLQSAAYLDRQHTIAPPGSGYAERLRVLVSDLQNRDGYTFNYRVYLKDEVNAFALADGTIRIYSGLMDLLDDGELLFVIGHEMGHVVKQHSRNQLRLAYAASAVRKGVGSQAGMAGTIARSQLGGLVELLTRAQFSQYEEKAADDYGLSFLEATDHPPAAAVSALEKLAGLARGHSFLSSHPDPGLRAERISRQIRGEAVSLEESRQNFTAGIKDRLRVWLLALFGNPAR